MMYCFPRLAVTLICISSLFEYVFATSTAAGEGVPTKSPAHERRVLYNFDGDSCLFTRAGGMGPVVMTVDDPPTRRFTRLTNAFSKKWENHESALALWFAFYNFGRKHMTLKETPAMASGLEDHIWTIRELIEESAKF